MCQFFDVEFMVASYFLNPSTAKRTQENAKILHSRIYPGHAMEGLKYIEIFIIFSIPSSILQTRIGATAPILGVHLGDRVFENFQKIKKKF